MSPLRSQLRSAKQLSTFNHRRPRIRGDNTLRVHAHGICKALFPTAHYASQATLSTGAYHFGEQRDREGIAKHLETLRQFL